DDARVQAARRPGQPGDRPAGQVRGPGPGSLLPLPNFVRKSAIVQGSTRQTLSYLKQLFRERGIRPKNKMGQSFLIDLNLVDLIVRTAELTAEDLALEVGSGTGSLTARLAQQAGAVVSVELDPNFVLLT